jgi:hypothetical protein
LPDPFPAQFQKAKSHAGTIYRQGCNRELVKGELVNGLGQARSATINLEAAIPPDL